jgi:hypothetical protein
LKDPYPKPDPDPGELKTYGSYPTDPEHCYRVYRTAQLERYLGGVPGLEEVAALMALLAAARAALPPPRLFLKNSFNK